MTTLTRATSLASTNDSLSSITSSEVRGVATRAGPSRLPPISSEAVYTLSVPMLRTELDHLGVFVPASARLKADLQKLLLTHLGLSPLPAEARVPSLFSAPNASRPLPHPPLLPSPVGVRARSRPSNAVGVRRLLPGVPPR